MSLPFPQASRSLSQLRQTTSGPARRRLTGRIVRTGNFLSLMLLALLACAPAQAAARPPALLGAATQTDVARFGLDTRLPDAGVVRRMPVEVNLQNVNPRKGAMPPQMTLDVFDGQSITINLDWVETRSADSYTWHGRVQGHPRGYALISVVNGKIAATIELGEVGHGRAKKYQVQSRAGGYTVLNEIDQDAFPPDHPPGGEALAAPVTNTDSPFAARGNSADLALPPVTAASSDTGALIDVLVVYSNQTATAAGSAIGAQIQHAVDTANTVYANSGITTRLRLVQYSQVSYNESGDYPTDLSWLSTNTGVAALRNSVGADLVSMFVEESQYCGYGWIGPSASQAFTVVNRGCSSGNYSFPHEIGHNFGARHDTFVDASTLPYAYGHGWVDCVEKWRDVMAYPSQCGGTRIPYFSNPGATYGSPPDPLGSTTTANVVRVHNQNAVTVANFRLSAQTGGCTYVLAPTGASVAAAGGSGSFGVTAGAGCAWSAGVSGGWLAIGSASGTTDSGTLYYTVAANTGPARTGTITVGGQAFTVDQASGCTFSLSPTSASFSALGTTGTTTLTTGAGCVWTASSSAAWLTVTSAASGTGSATVTYAVGANTGSARSANLTIGGTTFIASQSGAVTSTIAVATLSAAQLQMGTVKVGATGKSKSVTVSNSGGGILTIDSLTPGGANPGDFVRSGTCAVGTALAAGSTCTVQYVFRPGAKGGRSADLTIGTSAGTVALGLTGTGK